MILRFFLSHFFNLSHQSCTVVQDNPVSGGALNRVHLIPIEADITGHIIRLNIEQAVFQPLYFSSEMVSVVHDDHVFSFCLRRKAQARHEKRHEHETAGARERKNSHDHCLTPTKKRNCQ